MTPRFWLNLQTSDVSVASVLSKRFAGRIVVGVPARDFPRLQDGIALIEALHHNGVLVSAGLGDGAATEWSRALDLGLATRPFHLNQVFPAAALSQRVLGDAGALTVVNALVTPVSRPGFVAIGTGPRSSGQPGGEVPTDVALDMLVEVGVTSVKLFPLGGVRHLGSLADVAAAAAARDMMVEPTGGLTVHNLPAVLQTCVRAGAPRVMPHLYSSLKSSTGALDLDLVDAAMAVLDRFERQGGP